MNVEDGQCRRGEGTRSKPFWHRRAGVQTGIPVSLRACASAGTHVLNVSFILSPCLPGPLLSLRSVVNVLRGSHLTDLCTGTG